MSARKGGRKLLHGVSGIVCGGFCAVMGPSGSGKSTLLNALALRLDPKTAITGERRLNGKPYTTGGRGAVWRVPPVQPTSPQTAITSLHPTPTTVCTVRACIVKYSACKQ